MAKNPAKELYAQLRRLSCEELWETEVPHYDRASASERIERVGLVRAVGVVFAESGTNEQKEAARAWLAALLKDPAEKVRRYAMAALPKLGASQEEEAALLGLLETQPSEREKKFIGQSLDKIGGAATLRALPVLSSQTRQKVQANVARLREPSSINLDAKLDVRVDVRLHCRKGLEEILGDELRAHPNTRDFEIKDFREGVLTITSPRPFSLGDIYSLRCFGHAALVLGKSHQAAGVIASPLSQKILSAFTTGAIRYRIEFLGRGHQRGAVRTVADEVYRLCPNLLNDARNAPWAIEISPDGTVELRPRMVPDPAFCLSQGRCSRCLASPPCRWPGPAAGPTTRRTHLGPFLWFRLGTGGKRIAWWSAKTLRHRPQRSRHRHRKKKPQRGRCGYPC